MHERIKTILEAVSGGAWAVFDGPVGHSCRRQCVFCTVAPGFEHADWCPVKMAQQVLEENANGYVNDNPAHI